MKPEFERQIAKLQRESMAIGAILLGAIGLVLIAAGILIDWDFLCPR